MSTINSLEYKHTFSSSRSGQVEPNRLEGYRDLKPHTDRQISFFFLLQKQMHKFKRLFQLTLSYSLFFFYICEKCKLLRSDDFVVFRLLSKKVSLVVMAFMLFLYRSKATLYVLYNGWQASSTNMHSKQSNSI